MVRRTKKAKPKYEMKRRMIVSVHGQEKTGKNHFALTAPGPIVLFNLDNNLEGTIEKFLEEGKDIDVRDYIMPEARDLDVGYDWKATWESLKRDFLGLIDDPCRTIVIDTGTDMWAFLRMARLGKMGNVMPHHYVEVNTEYSQIIKVIKNQTDKNLIILHKTTEIYENGQSTGRYGLDGFKHTGGLVHVNVRTEHDPEEGFSIYIQNCQQNMSLAGEWLEGQMCSFPMLASMVFKCSPSEFE